MSVISVVINETDHHRLEKEHAAIVKAWSSLGNKTLPPTFAHWVGTRLIRENDGVADDATVSEMRVFNAIEKLIVGLSQTGFSLAFTGAENNEENCSNDLAAALVRDFQLQPHYTKRLTELFKNYLRNAREIADDGNVGVTNKAYGALTEAYRQLIERTEEAIPKLGTEKAIGRIEGATAILVGIEMMDRATAKKRTSAFKAKARSMAKRGWIGKIFGES